VISVALTRTPRPPAEEIITELWTVVSGAVGLPAM
jgi:hypothetical protein